MSDHAIERDEKLMAERRLYRAHLDVSWAAALSCLSIESLIAGRKAIEQRQPRTFPAAQAGEDRDEVSDSTGLLRQGRGA